MNWKLEWSFQHAVLAWFQGDPVAVLDAPNTGTEDGPRSTCVGVDDER